MRILLVEDLPELRTILADLLRETGHEVIEAYDVETATQALIPEALCEAVITDMVLPVEWRACGSSNLHKRLRSPFSHAQAIRTQ
jgi:DNA-binding response OmpR family regulator